MGAERFNETLLIITMWKCPQPVPPSLFSLYSFLSIFIRPYSNIAGLCGVVAQLPLEHSWRSRSVAKPHTYCQRKFLLVSNGEGESSASAFTYSPPWVSQEKKSQSGLFSSTLLMINMRHTYCRKYWFLNKMTTQREKRREGRTQKGKINKEKLYNLLCNRQTLNVCVSERAE